MTLGTRTFRYRAASAGCCEAEVWLIFGVLASGLSGDAHVELFATTCLITPYKGCKYLDQPDGGVTHRSAKALSSGVRCGQCALEILLD